MPVDTFVVGSCLCFVITSGQALCTFKQICPPILSFYYLLQNKSTLNVPLPQCLLTNGRRRGIAKFLGALYEYRKTNKFCIGLRSTQMQYLGMGIREPYLKLLLPFPQSLKIQFKLWCSFLQMQSALNKL